MITWERQCICLLHQRQLVSHVTWDTRGQHPSYAHVWGYVTCIADLTSPFLRKRHYYAPDREKKVQTDMLRAQLQIATSSRSAKTKTRITHVLVLPRVYRHVVVESDAGKRQVSSVLLLQEPANFDRSHIVAERLVKLKWATTLRIMSVWQLCGPFCSAASLSNRIILLSGWTVNPWREY